VEITLENFNTFLKEYPIKNIDCPHNILTEYEQIFKIYEGKYGYLSYLEFKTFDNTETFLGSYPLNGAELYKCKKCGKLKFFYTETGGHFPKTVFLDVSFDKKYLSDPSSKSVSIRKEFLNKFLEKFEFEELKAPIKIVNISGIKTIDKNKKYVFGYFDRNENIDFNIIAERKILEEIYKFEKEQERRTTAVSSNGGIIAKLMRLFRKK
jgi:hypothetical protein